MLNSDTDSLQMYVVAVSIKVIVQRHSKVLCNVTVTVTESSICIIFEQYECVYVSRWYEFVYVSKEKHTQTHTHTHTPQMYLVTVRIEVIVEGHSKLLCNVTECSIYITFQQYECVYVSRRYDCVYVWAVCMCVCIIV